MNQSKTIGDTLRSRGVPTTRRGLLHWFTRRRYRYEFLNRWEAVCREENYMLVKGFMALGLCLAMLIASCFKP
jgi:hypothetical protein